MQTKTAPKLHLVTTDNPFAEYRDTPLLTARGGVPQAHALNEAVNILCDLSELLREQESPLFSIMARNAEAARALVESAIQPTH